MVPVDFLRILFLTIERLVQMADISIQFHALPEEILPLLRSFVEDVQGHVIAIKFQPFEAVEVDRSALGEAFEDASVRRLAVTLQPPVLPAPGMNEFLDHNPSALLLDVGRRSAASLKESWLTARTEDIGALAEWRKFADQLRRVTH